MSLNPAGWPDRLLGHPAKIVAFLLIVVAIAAILVRAWSASANWLLLTALMQVAQALWGALVTLKKPWAERHHHAVLLGYFLFASIGVTATVMQSSRTSLTNQQLAQSLKDLSESTAKSSTLQAESGRLQERNLRLQEQLITLSNKAIGSTTGGDSFCYLQFTEGMIPLLIHVGRFPLYDVSVRVYDETRHRREPNNFTLWNDQTFGPVNLAAGMTWFDRGLKIGFTGEDEQAFNIFFTARNGMWIESMRLRKRPDGRWDHAIRVSANGKKVATLPK